jgi:hypothetical protein
MGQHRSTELKQNRAHNVWPIPRDRPHVVSLKLLQLEVVQALIA